MSTGRAFDPCDASGRTNWVHLKWRGEVHVHLQSFSVFDNLVEAETIDVRFHLDPDGSINNAEIICTVRPAARNDQSASLRISAYTARAMQQLVCVRSRQECACASEATLASPPHTHRCRCIRSRAPNSFGGLLQVGFLCRRPGCACS